MIENEIHLEEEDRQRIGGLLRPVAEGLLPESEASQFSVNVLKFKGLLSSGSTVFTCRPVADNKQYVASLHAGHKKGVISVRDRTQFPTSTRESMTTCTGFRRVSLPGSPT